MQKTLRDGLILRSLSEGHASDIDNLPQFYKYVFGESGDPEPDGLYAWTRDLIDDAHPTTTLEDIWVVADPNRDAEAHRDQGGDIVSALLLIPQTWRYEDVEIGVGRVELVATHDDYRRRGLIREMMHAAHERSANLGHVMQGITGIPNYYRRFGYTMGVDLGSRMMLPLPSVPKLKDDAKPKFALRPVQPEEYPRLAEWDHYRAQGSALNMIRTPSLWDYEINTRSDATPFKAQVRIITRTNEDGQPTGEDVGYVRFRVPHAPHTGNRCFLYSYVVGDNGSYLETYEDVLRAVKAYAEAQYATSTDPDAKLPDFIYFDSSLAEPLETLVEFTEGGKVFGRTYSWYVRVPDMELFIQTIRPVLERRLEGSGANRYTGELKIGFFDLTGLVMQFEQGKITGVEMRPFKQWEENAAFPYHTFLNVLFGHLSMREMEHTLVEISGSREARVLIDALFPRRRSWLVPLA